jgi:PleD family two-component response regulator
MPEIDGYEVLKWIRHSPWKHIPTIMISALEQIDSVVKCIEMGAEDYLTKPFNFIMYCCAEKLATISPGYPPSSNSKLAIAYWY